jgi:hypothetical protein
MTVRAIVVLEDGVYILRTDGTLEPFLAGPRDREAPVNAVSGRVLGVLQAHPESRVFELAEFADLPTTTVALALRQLEREGLARRGQDEKAITTWSAGVCRSDPSNPQAARG